MPHVYRDPEKRKDYLRRYQLRLYHRRRADWLSANGPCAYCGSWADLEVDHVDRAAKLSHRIWSWSAERRERELAKCQVLCRPCHQDKTFRDAGVGAYGPHGPSGYQWGCRCPVCREGQRIRCGGRAA